MKLDETVGATSRIWQIFIRDSSSTTGAGLTGLTSGSSGLTAYYHKNTDTTATAISLTTMTVGTFTSSGFAEIDSANMPGWYQLCPPNAALSTGQSTSLHLKGATNMAPLPIEVQLVAYNPYDAVRLGLTALPNANAEASGGLYTRGVGAGQINQNANGQVDTNPVSWKGGTIPSPNVTGVPLVDDKYLLGTIYSTPATAGIQDINVKNMNNVAATSIATINANQGTTQPVNFTGTAGSALVKSDMVDVAGAAVSTSTAQIGVNAVNIGGSASAGAAGYVGLDWGHITAPTTAVDLSGTTISGLDNASSVNVTKWAGTTVAVPATAGIPEVNIKNINNQAATAAAGVTFPALIASTTNITAGTISITDNLKKNQALAGFTFGMTDDVTHAPLSGLTVLAEQWNGVAWVTMTNPVVDIGNGEYSIDFAAADTNYNVMTLRFTATGADIRQITLITQP